MRKIRTRHSVLEVNVVDAVFSQTPYLPCVRTAHDKKCDKRLSTVHIVSSWQHDVYSI